MGHEEDIRYWVDEATTWLASYRVLSNTEFGSKITITKLEIHDWIIAIDPIHWNNLTLVDSVWPWTFEVSPSLLTMLHLKFA
jgi:hypothetical protein